MRTPVTLSLNEQMLAITAQTTERLIERHARETASGIMKALVGPGASCTPANPGTIGRSQVILSGQGHGWEVVRSSDYRAKGEGPISLLSCALGITPGHAARMVLEMANASRFEPEIARAIEVAIDASVIASRGKAKRAGPPEIHANKTAMNAGAPNIRVIR